MKYSGFNQQIRVREQVEEKPDVTYSDVGGCKEQIEKLREVVETPLLHVRHHLNFKMNICVSASSRSEPVSLFLSRSAGAVCEPGHRAS